jgi:ABC-type uncharacterized transport system fused permease/ATPase subunit
MDNHSELALTSRPALLLLDESTSALDLKTEAAMYALVDALPGLTSVSVGHRPSLRPFDKLALHLDQRSGARMLPVGDSDASYEPVFADELASA